MGGILGLIGGILGIGIMVAGGVLAFGFARGFIRQRLRFVDAARSPLTPWIAGGLGLVLVLPFTIFPLISGATMAMVGLGAGLGARSGVKALQRGD
ncbi:MAG: hypothetical protein HOP28_03680 [Gemmatimonadales bacterium]|nr:hypothetical protein [Gemmatimonadales bacterium]